MFVAIDRTSKVAFAALHPRAARMIAAGFLRYLLEKLLYKVHKVLTDNGVQFTAQPHQRLPGSHRFDRVRAEYGGGSIGRPSQPIRGPTARWNG